MAPATLRAAGLWEEAITLESTDLLEEAFKLVSTAAVLTAVDTAYPARWIGRLGESAPPALWVQGVISQIPLIGIVGSRQIDQAVFRFATEIGKEAVQLNYGVVSGGAAGCDSAGAAGAVSADGSVIEILPHGIEHFTHQNRCGLSVCAPHEVFSTASAMERNTLIYAAAEATVVAQARFKSGGTWIGAVEATRKHICPLIVRDDGSPASKALIALGAVPINEAKELEHALSNRHKRAGLFEIG
jgi:predicted Rossmann fold nucleotide-binding protein DprA/Smf involved in DNA uptake